MSTKVYGASDDLIEFKGDVSGEVDVYGHPDTSALVTFSDGTILHIAYGKTGLAIWGITVLREGNLFESIVECSNEDAEPHSDVAHFRDGLKWAYAATEWQRVK